MARADQGVDAAQGAGRLGAALAASLLLHGALLGALPRAWHAAAPQVLPAPLHATLAPAPEARGIRQAVPRYFTADQLDRRPLIQSHVEPRFPVLALAPTGRVVLRLYVDEHGRVERIAVESGDPTGEFEAAAREAFAAARFLPGLKDGRPVRALLRVEVLFGSPHPDNS